jgi:SAM-dependent methyltransferase
MRKTTLQFWDDTWRRQAVANFDPASDAVTRQYDRMLHAAFVEGLRRWGGHAATLIELGCGGSVYLPYFAKTFGMRVTGLDYSDAGRALAEKNLAAQGVAGEIVAGDLFAPPDEMRGRFDVAFSAGLFEHFDDTAAVVTAAAAFLRPGGLMLSVIPNMTRLPGTLQRWLAPSIYAVHLPLDAPSFAAAHAKAGLEVLRCTYLMTLNLYVLRLRSETSPAGVLLRAVRFVAMRIVWWLERTLGRSFTNRVTSPYIICVARAPQPRRD